MDINIEVKEKIKEYKEKYPDWCNCPPYDCYALICNCLVYLPTEEIINDYNIWF